MIGQMWTVRNPGSLSRLTLGCAVRSLARWHHAVGASPRARLHLQNTVLYSIWICLAPWLCDHTKDSNWKSLQQSPQILRLLRKHVVWWLPLFVLQQKNQVPVSTELLKPRGGGHHHRGSTNSCRKWENGRTSPVCSHGVLTKPHKKPRSVFNQSCKSRHSFLCAFPPRVLTWISPHWCSQIANILSHFLKQNNSSSKFFPCFLFFCLPK